MTESTFSVATETSGTNSFTSTPPPPPPSYLQNIYKIYPWKRSSGCLLPQLSHLTTSCCTVLVSCLACSTQLPCRRCFQYKQIFLLLCHCSCVAKQFVRCVNEGIYAEPGRCLFWSTEEFFSKQLKSVLKKTKLSECFVTLQHTDSRN